MGNERETTAAAPASAPAAAPVADTGPRPRVARLFEWNITVVPQGYRGPTPRTNWLNEATYVATQNLYAQIAANTTKLKIYDTAGSLHGHSGGPVVAGFVEKIQRCVRRLLTTLAGRQLIRGVAEGGQGVEIRPGNASEIETHTNSIPNAANGTGASSVVYIDPALSDRSIRAYDRNSREIATPVFLILGHELIHAANNAAGTRDTTARTDNYNDNEEFNTIAGTSGVTENTLRRSYGLGQRDGHDTFDTGTRLTGDVRGGTGGG